MEWGCCAGVVGASAAVCCGGGCGDGRGDRGGAGDGDLVAVMMASVNSDLGLMTLCNTASAVIVGCACGCGADGGGEMLAGIDCVEAALTTTTGAGSL